MRKIIQYPKRYSLVSRKGLLILVLIFYLSTPSQTVTGQNSVTDVYYMEFSENVLISTSDTEYDYHVEPTLALGNNGAVYAGWKDAPSHNGGGHRVSYTYFDGIYWHDPILMPQVENNTRQSDPWMVSYHGKLYYSYLEFGAGITQLTLAETEDFGENWTRRSISNSEGFADKQTMIVRENGDMFAAYNDVGVGMRLISSFDGGQSFTDVLAIQDVLNDGTGAYIVAGEDEDLFVFYSNYGANDPTDSLGDIIFDKSSDSGQTWGVDQDINPTYNGSVFTYADNGVAVVSLPTALYDYDLGRLYVSWSDISTDPENLNFDVFMRYSDDEGDTWSERFQIDEDNGLNQWHPDMVIDSFGNIHIAYYDNSTEGYKLKHRTFFPSNETFSEETDIASEYTPGEFTRPGEYFGMEIDSNDRIHVIWSDGRTGKLDIFHSYMDLRIDRKSNGSKSISPISSIAFGLIIVPKIVIHLKRRLIQ